MSNYNPFRSAIAQLHTPEAIAYYKFRSQQDAETLLVVTVQVGCAIYEAAVMAYNLGVFARAWMHAMEQALRPATECTAIVPTEKGELLPPEIIDAEIVREPLLLPAGPVARVDFDQVERFVIQAIAPQTMQLALAAATPSLIASELALLPPAKKSTPKDTQKPRATTRKPRSKTAFATQPAPTMARVGQAIAPID